MKPHRNKRGKTQTNLKTPKPRKKTGETYCDRDQNFIWEKTPHYILLTPLTPFARHTYADLLDQGFKEIDIKTEMGIAYAAKIPTAEWNRIKRKYGIRMASKIKDTSKCGFQSRRRSRAIAKAKPKK